MVWILTSLPDVWNCFRCTSVLEMFEFSWGSADGAPAADAAAAAAISVVGGV